MNSVAPLRSAPIAMTDLGDRHAPVSMIAMGEIRSKGEDRPLEGFHAVERFMAQDAAGEDAEPDCAPGSYAERALQAAAVVSD